jgi:RimJ/RimL family protein N-acetyltransferase
MEAIETSRLIIRNFHAEDWQDLLEIAIQYEASAYAQYDHQWPTSEDKVRGATAWFAEGDRFLAVCLKTTHKLIGLISLSQKEEEEGSVFGLGYLFNFDYHGKGYATEGCRAVLAYAFGHLAADGVKTGTAEANHPSCRLLKRLGLQETGRSTASFRKTPDGRPIEFVALSFAISRDEWLAPSDVDPFH